ncbi:MAG: SH3 domain-containing protein [Dorea sp.]|nr:SH3 domain-containing protein [Dorea sp.]
MHRRNIAAVAAVMFLSSTIGISAYAAPEKETETERQTETQSEIEREAGFVSIEELPIETESETEKTDQTENQTSETESTETEIQESETAESETEQEIESPKVEETFHFFQVDKKYAISKRDQVYLYEKKDVKSDKVGKINSGGVLHILEEEDGWYYVESGKARGFVKASYLRTGDTVDRYIEHKKEKNLDTAEVLKDSYENEAFLYTQTTAYKAVVKKKYAITKKKIRVYDSIPEMEERDTLKETEAKKTEKEKTSDEPEVVGILERGGLCYILDDEQEEWCYVESGDVRGFVQTKQLETGQEVKKEIEEKGEDKYTLAEEKIAPEKNKACYYTVTSVKEASVSGLIRTSMVEYAQQFLGNPYVWGGTSLTNGADCSGFVQSIYAQFGYSIPRVAEDQAACATKIPVEDALPGDLIFYQRSDGYIYHVVMSTGDGGTIEAQSSATGIVRSTVNYGNAAWAVRIISDEDTDILDALKEKKLAAEHYDNTVIAKNADYGSFLGSFKLTAYCSCPICCGPWSGGPTASGKMPTEEHTVAMAGLPFGTELIINGQVYTVEDRGTPYGHVDIYMNDHQQALQFGVQYADVYLKK